MNTVYVHYGSKQYDPQRFSPIKNQALFSKPEGGLWGSPADCEYGWKQWCEANEFRDCSEDNSFMFTLNENANLLVIGSVDDLNGLPVYKPPIPIKISAWVSLDFEKLVENGVDAIRVDMNNGYSRGRLEDSLYFKLYGWDCSSILVMNKEVIVIE